MSNPEYSISSMTRNDIDIAIDWAANEGWNPGLHDADSFYNADPGGFLMGRLDGEPISAISAIRYGDSFGFIGFYIVKPKYRDLGYGMHIWNVGMAHLEGRNIGLDGVIEQQANYKKSNFNLAYRNIRQQGYVEDISKAAFQAKNTGISGNGFQITDLRDTSFNTIEKYDRQLFPDNRTVFLKSWLRQPEKIALGISKHDELYGWGIIRPCREGYKIGPLYADQPSLAESLFIELTARTIPGSPIFLDTPEANSQAISLASKFHMVPIFETARMYTGTFPEIPMEKYFGVTSFELG